MRKRAAGLATNFFVVIVERGLHDMASVFRAIHAFDRQDRPLVRHVLVSRKVMLSALDNASRQFGDFVDVCPDEYDCGTKPYSAEDGA